MHACMHVYIHEAPLIVGGAPNYFPNSFSGPVDDVQKFGTPPVDTVLIMYMYMYIEHVCSMYR